MRGSASYIVSSLHEYRQRKLDLVGPWQLTPRWHPYYWFGLTCRRWYDEQFDAYWEYGRPEKVARVVLEELYG